MPGGLPSSRRGSLLVLQGFQRLPGGFPARPGVHGLGDPGGLLGFLDALGVDRGGLCTVPCPVQGFGKAAHTLAVQLPRLVHDLGEIVLLHSVLALLCGSAPV